MIRPAPAARHARGLLALALAAALLAVAAPTVAFAASGTPSIRAVSWKSDLSGAGTQIKVAEHSRDAENVERAVGEALDLLDRFSKQSKKTRSAAASQAQELMARAAHGIVMGYLYRVKDCKQNSIARMAAIAKKLRDGRATLSEWIGEKDRKWLKETLADLDNKLAACLHLSLSVDSFMSLKDPKWEVAGQFEVPLDFNMDPNGKPYWTGKQTAIVERVTLDNTDGCTWTIDPQPFTFDVRRLELDFTSILGTTSDVNLKEYATDIAIVDTATGVCPDNSPPPFPIWGWSMIFSDMRDYLTSGTWPPIRGWQTATVGGGAEMYKVLKETGSTGFTESTTLFLYRR